MQQSSLFDVDPESGSVVYVMPEEGEVIDDVGTSSVPSDEIGDLLEDPETLETDVVEIEKETSSMDILVDGSPVSYMVLDENVAAAILADAPASGSLGSSTIDYFDRIVSGIPYDAVYIAYRTDADDSYDGTLYFGRNYEISDNQIIFGDDTTQIMVDRTSSNGYNNVTNYYSGDASGAEVAFAQNGSILYYTNALSGYPVLGGYSQPVNTAAYLYPALICSVLTVVLAKLLLKR